VNDPRRGADIVDGGGDQSLLRHTNLIGDGW